MDKFLSVFICSLINPPGVNVVLDTLLLLIIFNANVAIIVLAQSEFTQVSIIIFKKNYTKLALHLQAAFGL